MIVSKMRVVLVAIGLLFWGGCDDEPSTESTETSPSQVATPTNTLPATTTPRSAPANVHLDLLALSHLADVDRAGLFIDFGTQSRFKYTSGNWNQNYIVAKRPPQIFFDVTHGGFGQGNCLWDAA